MTRKAVCHFIEKNGPGDVEQKKEGTYICSWETQEALRNEEGGRFYLKREPLLTYDDQKELCEATEEGL